MLSSTHMKNKKFILGFISGIVVVGLIVFGISRIRPGVAKERAIIQEVMTELLVLKYQADLIMTEAASGVLNESELANRQAQMKDLADQTNTQWERVFDLQAPPELLGYHSSV